MSEPLMSVAGQLVGIPAEKYSGINGITVDQNSKTISTEGNTWIDVRDEVNYNTSVIIAGGFRIYYNPFLKLVSLTSDVNVKAGSVSDRIMTWTDRLKPVDTVNFALGQGISLYVSATTLYQPSFAAERWINGCWMWPVQGEQGGNA